MALRIAKAAGLALVVLCWAWARYALWSDATAVIVVWCAPLFTFPLAIAGRKVLDAKPIARRAERVTILFHYGTMIALGVGIFRAFRLVGKSPGIAIPFPPSLGMALSIVTGVAMFLSVLNLALRGLGAPFAVRLSTRLATDWMYSWTRNPMLLCTLAWLFSLGLMYRSLWMVAWLAVSVSPGWIFFVQRYEERELQIRFGSGYENYRAQTPFLWPRRPRRAGSPLPQKSVREDRELPVHH